MKVHKYRAWHEGNKTMYLVVGIDWTKAEYWLKDEDLDPREVVWFTRFEKAKLMQYTGLKDKNGKEIYEGDIVKDGNDHWEDSNTKLHQKTGWVKYMDDIDEAKFQAVNGEYTGVEVKNDCYEGYFHLSSNCEVIGNIYENGELLK